MENLSLQGAAGFASTLIFLVSSLPMLIKAWRTRDLRSYSPVNISLANVGNLTYWLYIYSLPFGPAWLLHGFNTLSTLLMLVWYLRYVVQA